jgi:hypothetical protein
MKQINHHQLQEIIKMYYKAKQSLFIAGTFGIGKSFVVKDTTKEIAQSQQRIFIEWGKSSFEQKKAILTNPEKYFTLIDIRLSEYDSTDLKGLPDFYKEEESIIWKSPYWTKALEHPQSAGVLFFDEVNLAEQSTLKSCFKIFYDRQINEGTISDNWIVLSAGNLESDRSFVQELPYPLKDRIGEVELLEPVHDDWINWAIAHDIDYRIIGFIQFSPSKLRVVADGDTQKPTTQRGWELLSHLIKDEDDYRKLDLIVGTRIGEGIAREFLAFCKIKDIVQLEKIIQNPEEFKKITQIDMKYFVVSAIAEHYGKGNKVDFKKLLEISSVLDEMGSAEFITLMWRLSVKYNSNKFRKDFQSKELDNPLRVKYNKFLMPNV